MNNRLSKYRDTTDQCEEALICGILKRPGDYFEAADWITAKDFHNASYGALFAAIGEMTAEGIDLAKDRVLSNEIIRRGLAERVGGMKEIIRLIADAVPGHVRYYAEQVAKHAQRRRVVDAIVELQTAVMEPEFEPAEIAALSQRLLTGAAEDRGSEIELLGDVMENYVNKLEESRERKSWPCVTTGFAHLDATLGGGIPNGSYAVLAARPSIGKSALAVEIAKRVAGRCGPALFISLEMTGEQLSQRMLTQDTSISQSAIMTASYTDEQLLEMIRAVAKAKDLPLTVWQASGATISRIESKIRSEITRRGIKLVVIDYLGLIKGDARQPTFERVSQISGEIARISKQLNIAILVLCQLSRASEGEQPKLNHLRDSGAIEQDADIVMLLHRDARDSQDAVLSLEKVRQGSIGRVSLVFDKGTFRDAGDPAFNYSNDF